MAHRRIVANKGHPFAEESAVKLRPRPVLKPIKMGNEKIWKTVLRIDAQPLPRTTDFVRLWSSLHGPVSPGTSLSRSIQLILAHSRPIEALGVVPDRRKPPKKRLPPLISRVKTPERNNVL